MRGIRGEKRKGSGGERRKEKERGGGAKAGEETHTGRDEPAVVGSESGSAEGERNVSGREEKTRKVWVTQPGQGPLTLRGHAEAGRSVSFRPDGLFF